ncbi:hypothetical protein OOZ15_11395 [Galbibacter sp. EGI 63066]|uniref:fibronectin type III domain-containing protein n=1 Tax=Galbibacter sp. EGI 63066 TaxID=2993559 RepID=UPI002248FF08|nr:hypothetical protein [Galbibacter sp. EGI 63066]MCX2680547.1 hypothetical protein [Galbibacter sp. EGI 63066]
MRIKHIHIIAFLLLGKLMFSQEPEKPAIKVLARSLEDKVLLRWAPTTPYAWNKLNTIGYYLERVTVSRNGEAVLPLETITLNQTPIKPAPLEQWETIANADNNAAVLAQALYGDSFEVTARVGLDAVMEANSQQQQRFTFGLLAAEQSYEAAKMAGLGYEDASVTPGERYLYRVKVANPEAFQIEEGSVYAGTDMYEALPKPVDFAVVFGDKETQISWNFSLLKNTYTSYQVERSNNGSTYKKLNKQPIFNAEKNIDDPTLSLFMVDSIPNNKTYHYRVRGISSFGETGPPTEPVKGQARELLKYNPHIIFKDILDNKTAIIEWEFPKEGEEKINGFELRRANTATGNYETVFDNISPQTRKATYDKLRRINYFKVVAMGKNGKENPSFAAMVQPVDSIPPKAPLNLQGTIDTTGVVNLSWDKNTEPDLSGYRVYRSNNIEAEFAQITNKVYTETTFVDTISVKNLNENIYYKILAQDQRYNASGFSEILTLEKPDMSAPSPPVIEDYEVTENGVDLRFIPSSSEDVSKHIVYRKNLGVTDGLWEQIAIIDTLTPNEYNDTEIENGKPYSYTVTAIDEADLESSPANPVSVRTQAKIIKAGDIRFSGFANREMRFITLTWKAKADEIVGYKIYRAQDDKQLKLYKTLDGTVNRYEDNALEINTQYRYGLQVMTNGGVLSEIKRISIIY